VGAERFRCAELFFQPTLIGLEAPGLGQQVAATVKACEPDIREEMYNNLLLAGGSSMFPGFQVRVEKEVQPLAPATVVVQCHAPLERKYSAWIGGSILASLSTFDEMWITMDEYDEAGPSVVHRKYDHGGASGAGYDTSVHAQMGAPEEPLGACRCAAARGGRAQRVRHEEDVRAARRPRDRDGGARHCVHGAQARGRVHRH